MAQETIVLVNELSDRFVTAEDSLNNNFNDIYAAMPPSLTGEALKYLRVKADESGVEWVTGGGGASAFTDLTDVPSSYSGSANYIVRVNAARTALEFISPTTAILSDSTNKRYCTDAEKTVIGNTSGTNTGDQTLSSLGGITQSNARRLTRR